MKAEKVSIVSINSNRKIMGSSTVAQEAPVINGMNGTNSTNGTNGTASQSIPTPLEWVHNQYGATGDSMLRPANWTAVYEEPLYTPRTIRVITIGAGFSGLMVAHKVSPPGPDCKMLVHPALLNTTQYRYNMTIKWKTTASMSSTRRIPKSVERGMRTNIQGLRVMCLHTSTLSHGRQIQVSLTDSLSYSC
jgi:hypothetical protein